MIRRPRLCRSTCLAATLLLLPTPPAAAELGPGWEALPGETIAALRAPDTQGFLDALAETRAGQLIFTQERFDGVLALIEEADPEQWETFAGDLEEAGFTVEDLLKLARSSWGGGVVATPQDDEVLPRFSVLAWADLTEEEIDQLYASMDRNDEEPEEGQRRVDLELAGLPVRQYSNAEEEYERAEWDAEDQEAKPYEPQKTDESHLLVTRMPGRLLVAVGFPQSGDRIERMLAEGTAPDQIDWDEATRVELLHATFARFLEAQEGGAGDDAFAGRMLGEADIADAVGKDASLLEYYLDVPRVMDVIESAVAEEEGAEDAQMFATVIEALGLDGLGVAAGSAHLGEGALRLDTFVQMAAPRAGLLATLDGQTLPAAPPAWVPAGVSYGHLAYDLGKLYDVVIQTITATAGPEAAQQVMMGNMMVQAQVQADIPTILRSLGVAHRAVVMEGREVTAEVQEYDFDAEEMKTVERTTYVQPTALVWDPSDAAVWDRVMAAIKGFAPMAGPDSGIELTDEQGFTGLRVENPQMGTPMGFMLGQGHLVLGIGPEATARTLTALTAPPAGGGLADSEDYRAGDALLGYEPGIAFGIQDLRKDAIAGKRQFDLAVRNGQIDLDPELADKIRALLPTDDEINESFGVSVGQVTMTDGGLKYKAASAMPGGE
ncbi:MAG: hypothetical protein AAF800_02245 [Planctomycetota bacterium]